MTQPAPQDPATIGSWHVHVYYDPERTREIAAGLREWVAARFPAALLGRWHDRPIGPHTAAMYQIAFAPDLFPALVPFLALNRGGLSILLHPETGDAVADHTVHALWLGPPLRINAAVLRGHD